MKLIEDEISGNWIVSIEIDRWVDFFEWWPGTPESRQLHDAMYHELSEWLRENARLDWTGNYLPLYSLRYKESLLWTEDGRLEFHFYRRELAFLFVLTWSDYARND